jgi:hypothetical protein
LRLVKNMMNVPALDSADWQQKDQIEKTFTLDGSPPQGLKFVAFPKELPRGERLPVKAVAHDDESKIAKVNFFVGKPGPDGKLPPNTVLVPGKPADNDLWVAALDAPTDQKGKLEVTVQATNGANLTASETVTIQLLEPVPVVKLASIEGDVVQGDRNQLGVAVALYDALGALKDGTTTDDKGHYVFKNLPPGTYRVAALKSSDNTKGAVAVSVLGGQEKKGVNIKLMR